MTGRWWRRNWWGLVVLVPILAAAMLLHPNEPVQRWREAQPDPVVAGADGWVGYAGARIRLAGLEPVELVDSAGEPFPLADGVRAWQATLAIEPGGDPGSVLGCELRLEDDRGRRYGNAPTALRGAQLPGGDRFIDGRCGHPDDEPGSFETVAMFVLPASARPVALRLSHFEHQPGYARLDVS